MKHLSIVQHTQSEWLGHIEDHLEGRGIRFGYHRPFASGGTLPSAMTVGDGLVLVGGGPWGAASTAHQPPWLEAEIKLARACLMMGKPVIGIGLGSQVLAIAADGGAAEAPFVCCVATAHRTEASALAGRLPEQFPFVVYGRDRAVPPGYATILANDDAGLPAVFQIGSNAIGFAGHPGLRPAMIEDLIMEFDEAPDGVADQLPLIKSVASAIENALVPIMTGLVELAGWMRQ
jgi:GMP synthase-like glutamine amidotransferase